MGYSSNFPDVAKSLVTLSKTFGMRRPMQGKKTLGEEIASLVATTIYERTAIQKRGPDDEPLAKLKVSTILRKMRRGYAPVLGIETGEMLAKAQMEGHVEVTDDTVSLEYGMTPEAEERAEWFQEGRGTIQEQRFFYDIGDDGKEKLGDYIDGVAEAARAEFEGS